MSDLGLWRFHDALRIMHALSRRELADGGVFAADDGAAWHRFRSNPAAFMVRGDQETAARIWRLIEARHDVTSARAA